MDGPKLNAGWALDRAAKADPTKPIHWIYASSFKKTPIHFPLVWDRGLEYVSAVNATPFYLGRQKVRIRVLDKPGGTPVPAEVRLRLDGALYASDATRPGATDGGDFRFELPAAREYEVEVLPATGPKIVRGTLRTTAEPEQNVSFFVRE